MSLYDNSLYDDTTLTSEILGKIDSRDVDFQPVDTKFVVHTSTIPLASTFDAQYLLSRKGCITLSMECLHGQQRNTHQCSNRSCMYASTNGNFRYPELLPENCPCKQTLQRREVEPLCFLSFLKSATRHLIKDGERDTKIDLKTVMFCFDGQGVFDTKYSGMVRDKFGLTSWSKSTEQSLPNLLHGLYWFRKHSRRFRLKDLVERSLEILPLRQVKMWIKQTIHTINGLLIKQFFSLGPEIDSYAKLNEHIARLFKHLFAEYIGEFLMDEFNTQPIFQEIKDFSKSVKEHGLGLSLRLRTRFLHWKFKNPALAAFYTSSLKKLRATIEFQRTRGIDVTTSLAWKFRIAELHQTRVLGYVPPSLAEKLSAKYRKDVTRPRKPQDPKRLRLVELLVLQELKENSGIPPEFLRMNLDDSEDLNNIKKVLSKIELDLKPTASVRSLVKEGGKLEDSRIALKIIREKKILIPVRNLENLEISHFLPPLEEDFPDDISVYLFFLSLQLVMNFLVKKKKLLPKYLLKLEGFTEFTQGILDAVIVHIDEPGKLRELIKNSPILSWFLSPGSKLCQNTLAIHPDHKAGLELGNQDWSHIKRISGDSPESRFMYDSRGKIRPAIQFGFEDWSQATDFLSRLIGLSELKAFMQYIGFPRGYGNLILAILELPQEVSTLVRYRIANTGEEEILERIEIPFKGKIHEGFMMGNQITKTILHLTHVGQKSLALAKLAGDGISFKNQNDERTRLRPVPPDLSSLRDAML